MLFADGSCVGRRSVTKTDNVTVTAPSAGSTKAIKIRVAWGTWRQVYVSQDCSYTISSDPYSPPTLMPTVTPAAAMRMTGLGMLAFSAPLVHLLVQLQLT